LRISLRYLLAGFLGLAKPLYIRPTIYPQTIAWMAIGAI